MGEGACSPGDIDTGGSCGNCGMQRRSCDATCSWGAWTCDGEGECAVGAVDEEMQSCGGCAYQTKSTCAHSLVVSRTAAGVAVAAL